METPRIGFFKIKMTLLYILILITVAECSEKQPVHHEMVLNNSLLEKKFEERKPIPYDAFLEFVHSKRKQLITTKQAKKYLFEIMNEEIPYYWCGTTWDFNGTTQIPKSGAIACGYFVTTVLKQIGFNLNRVKLAQQASSVMIKSLCKNIQKANGFEVFKEKVKSLPDSTISIVGLDFHVGFILKGKDGNSYFLHSNYINSRVGSR